MQPVHTWQGCFALQEAELLAGHTYAIVNREVQRMYAAYRREADLIIGPRFAFNRDPCNGFTGWLIQAHGQVAFATKAYDELCTFR